MLNKHKIIDCFLFYNELDMLEFRLTELNEHVDYFIILDSDFDFAGNKKDSMFESNKNRFDSWKEKIQYFLVEKPAISSVFVAIFGRNLACLTTQYKYI